MTVFRPGDRVEHDVYGWVGMVVEHVTANVRVRWSNHAVPKRHTKRLPPEESHVKPSSLSKV